MSIAVAIFTPFSGGIDKEGVSKGVLGGATNDIRMPNWQFEAREVKEHNFFGATTNTAVNKLELSYESYVIYLRRSIERKIQY